MITETKKNIQSQCSTESIATEEAIERQVFELKFHDNSVSFFIRGQDINIAEGKTSNEW